MDIELVFKKYENFHDWIVRSLHLSLDDESSENEPMYASYNVSLELFDPYSRHPKSVVTIKLFEVNTAKLSGLSERSAEIGSLSYEFGDGSVVISGINENDLYIEASSCSISS